MSRNFLMLLSLFTIASCVMAVDSKNQNPVSVVISNGKTQCQNNALPISITKNYLLDVGIEVRTQHCGILNGVMYPSVCGGRTGQLHVFTITRDNIIKAQELGFEALTHPKKEITEVSCDDFIGGKRQ